MRRFVELLSALEFSHTAPGRIDALRRYLVAAPPVDAAWAVALLSGMRPPRVTRREVLRQWVLTHAALSERLLQSCESAVGHPFEAWSLLWPAPSNRDDASLADWMGERLPTWAVLDDTTRATHLAQWVVGLEPLGRELLFRMLAGEALARWPASELQRAIAAAAALDLSLVALRWPACSPVGAQPRGRGRRRVTAQQTPARLPDPDAWRRLTDPADADEPLWLPRPLPARGLLDSAPEALGPAGAWLAVACPRGDRVQWIQRAGRHVVWSSEGLLVSEHFQEPALPWPSNVQDVALHGVLVDAAAPDPASITPSTRFVVLDLLRCNGEDLTGLPVVQRRRRLEALHGVPAIAIAPTVSATRWSELRQRHARSHHEGVVEWWLDRIDAPARPGQAADSGAMPEVRSLAWPAADQRLLALVAYAQARAPGWSPPDPQGHAQLVHRRDAPADRSTAKTTDEQPPTPMVGAFQFTLGLWNRPPSGADEVAAWAARPASRGRLPATCLQLMPVAVAVQVEGADVLRQLEAHVRDHTVERFGPARRLWPVLPVEITFSQARVSRRHKGGWQLAEARILRVRAEASGHEAATLADLEAPEA